MTKLKNTKKGMAKKALSISLVAAMLATSNVPVWAAEFGDGTDVVDVFTDDASVDETEAPVVEDEAPAAEEVVDDMPMVQAETTDSTTTSRLVKVSASENGWASFVTVSGKVLQADLTTELEEFDYQWMVPNNQGGYREIEGGSVEDGLDNDGIVHFAPGAENIGKQLYLHISKKDDGNNNIDVMIPAGTVSKQDVNNRNREPYMWVNQVDGTGTWDATNHECVYPYLKKEIKPSVSSLTVTFENGTTLDLSQFDISYTHSKGNFIDADSECEVVATPKDSDLYTGIITEKYRIRERYYQAGDITAAIPSTKTYEYTGAPIVPEKNDVVLTESIRKTVFDSEKVIDEIWTDETKWNVGTHNVGLSLIDVPNYVQTSLPKKGKFEGADARLLTTYNIVQRDLSKCTVEIDAVSLNGKSITTIVNDSSFASKVHIYDENKNELNLVLNGDYEVVLPTDTPTQNGTYSVSIKAKGSNTKNYAKTTLTITTHDFDDCHFINSVNHNIEEDAGNIIKSKVPYTGENVSKNLSGLRFARWVGGSVGYEPLEDGKDYKITIAGINAGKNQGRIIVEGLRSYEGARKVYYFDIQPAYVHNSETGRTDVTVDSKVVFDRGNTHASDYAPKVTVKAHNMATPDKEFVLTEGKDYTVKYAFKTRNEIGAKIVTTITITNPNFKGADKVITRETTISRKQLSNCNIEVLGSYTYTGAAIIPDVKVTDVNGEVLTKGVDYKVVASNNIDVTDKATVTVIGVDQNEDGDGIYDPASSKSTTFSITPANANDIKVVFARGNTGVMYTGKNIKPTIVGVTLNGNDVTQQFDISYPTTNINVGTGSVVLTPVKGNKNFIGTKTAEFKIIPRELKGTLVIYDEDGRKYETCSLQHEYEDENGVIQPYYDTDFLAYPGGGKDGDHVTFDYDGNKREFKDAVFIPDTSDKYSKYVTTDDYEIKYVDNVYGGTAYIYVEGKGNFSGKGTIKDAENNVVNSVVEGTAYKFSINTYQFKKQHVTIGNAEYAAGQSVKPEVTVTVMGQKLVEGKDYILHYDNRTELTNGKTQKVEIEGIKAFAGSWEEGYFAVVKRNMQNTDITVTEKNNGEYDVVVKNTGVVVPSSEYTVTTGDGTITVTANENSKYYTGSKTVDVEEELKKPGTPMIVNVIPQGNTATAVLSGEVAGAEGYDYVIGKSKDCIVTKDYSKVIKGQLLKGKFTYVESGTYYAYCHAWKRDENGKKVFGDWSNAFPVVVSAVTPERPTNVKVKVSGSTVKVTYKESANAAGYDVVLGTLLKKVNDEMRPVEYGTLVKKIKKGTTVTATFKNVPKGTYYVGLHAYTRLSEDGKKVFSPWALYKNGTPIRVK